MLLRLSTTAIVFLEFAVKLNLNMDADPRSSIVIVLLLSGTLSFLPWDAAF